MVAGWHARGHEGKPQSVRAAVHADTISRPAKCGELPLKFLHHQPANESRIAEGLLHHRQKLFLEFLMRRHEIKKWYFLRVRHGSTFSPHSQISKTSPTFPPPFLFH